MRDSQTVAAYLETVAEQIRWKRARPVLVRELEQHLMDQRDAFVKAGKPEDEAEQLAVEDMGDPVEVGAALDAVHRPRPQWGLLGLTIALAAVCTALRLVLTAGWRFDGESLPLALLALLLGTGAMVGLYLLDISRLARHAVAIYIGTVVLGIGCVFFNLSRLSPRLSHFTYYLSLFLPVVYALWVYACRGKGWPGLLGAIAGGIPLVIVSACWYPSVTTLEVLVCSGFVLMLCAAWWDWFGVRRGTAAVLGVSALLGWAIWTLWLRHMARWSIIFHPEQDPLGAGWFILKVRSFLRDIPPLRSGAEGVDASIGSRVHPLGDPGVEEALGRDFLPSILAARWGWLPLAMLTAAMAALVLWLAVRALRQKNRAGRLVALSVALAIGLWTVFSMVLNLGVLIFGASYPLLGGNTFLVADMTLIGLALSVFRGSSIAREAPEEPVRRRKRLRIRVEYQ